MDEGIPGLVIILSLGMWWFSTWYIAVGFCLTGFLCGHWTYVHRCQQQLATAVALINSHAEELTVRRKQTIFRDNYGIVEASDWTKEIDKFIDRVIESATGAMSPKTRSKVSDYIWDCTARYRATRMDFHPQMDPIDYEVLVADTLRDLGWDTVTTKATGDHGRDVIATMRNKKAVIQCKRYSSPVGVDAVQQATSGKIFEQAHCAAVVSNSSFTRQAQQHAAATGTLLLNHEQLGLLEQKVFGTSTGKKATAIPATSLATSITVPSVRSSRDQRTVAWVLLCVTVIVGVLDHYNRDAAAQIETFAAAVAKDLQPTDEKAPNISMVPKPEKVRSIGVRTQMVRRENAHTELASSTASPSFDCTKASSVVEKLICSTPELATADSEMANFYKKNIVASGSNAAQIKQGQRAFVSARNECSTVACIAETYRARYEELAQLGYVKE